MIKKIIKKLRGRTHADEKKEVFRLEGYDTFEAGSTHGDHPFYPIEGEYDTLAQVERAGRRKLAELEKDQPTESSGGQGVNGIQDRVFIVYPDGSKVRFMG